MNAPEAIANVVMVHPSSSLDSHSLRGLCAPSGACARHPHQPWRDKDVAGPEERDLHSVRWSDRVRAGTASQSGSQLHSREIAFGCGFWQKFCWLRPSSLSRAKTRARPAPVDRGGPSASDPSTQTSRPVRSDPPIAARDRSKTRRAPFHPSRSRVKFQLRLGEWIIPPTSRTRRYYARPCAPDRDPLLPFPTTQRERRIIRDRPLTDARSFPDAHDQVRARIPVSLRPDAPTPVRSVLFHSLRRQFARLRPREGTARPPRGRSVTPPRAREARTPCAARSARSPLTPSPLGASAGAPPGRVYSLRCALAPSSARRGCARPPTATAPRRRSAATRSRPYFRTDGSGSDAVTPPGATPGRT